MKLERATEIVERFKTKRVAVVGDLMLDRYIWGTASRISQEAPVPVVTVKNVTSSPGGAANVLWNLTSMGAEATAFGIIGNDRNGDELLRILENQNVDVVGMIKDESRITTEKTRIIAGTQQIVRVDTEEINSLDPRNITELLETLEARALGGGLHGIIIEDYAKGLINAEVLKGVAEIGARHNIPIAQDPHPGNEAYIDGLTILTPNRTEAFAMAGVYFKPGVYPIEDDAPLREVVHILEERWKPNYLLITLGSGGMVLFEGNEDPIHIPTKARDVFDVSGAGDTVIASFVLAMLADATPREAAIISNHAAGVVVGKVGTAATTVEELLRSFELDDE